MDRYDFIFAGSGCAALSLVFHLNRSSLSNKSILLIDPIIDQVPNKTWCYWAKTPLPIHPEKSIYSWGNLDLTIGKNKIRRNLGDLKYYHINSIDFFESLFKEFKSQNNISFKESSVKDIQENSDGVLVTTTTGEKLYADIVFDSRFPSNDLISSPYMKQVFAGWKVETEKPIFDTKSFTLMEFAPSTKKGFDFFYILPFSPTSALIEYTAYSHKVIQTDILENELKKYLSKNITDHYSISFKESGIIPMTNKKIRKLKNDRIIPIGTAGGWTKASTGYTFQKIQENSNKIIGNIEKGIYPLQGIYQKRRHEFYDNILLNIASKWPEKLIDVFADLFQKNSPEKVFRFLSEETSFLNEISLLGRLDYSIFIKSLFHYETH